MFLKWDYIHELQLKYNISKSFSTPTILSLKWGAWAWSSLIEIYRWIYVAMGLMDELIFLSKLWNLNITNKYINIFLLMSNINISEIYWLRSKMLIWLFRLFCSTNSSYVCRHWYSMSGNNLITIFMFFLFVGFFNDYMGLEVVR